MQAFQYHHHLKYSLLKPVFIDVRFGPRLARDKKFYRVGMARSQGNDIAKMCYWTLLKPKCRLLWNWICDFLPGRFR